MSKFKSCLKLFFLLFTIFFIQNVLANKIHFYKESNRSFKGPDKGFFLFYIKDEYGYNRYFDLSKSPNLNGIYNSGFTLISSRISLDNFRYEEITDDYLQNLQDGFDAVRENGLKVILRFNYNNGNEKGSDSTTNHIINHISKLSPVINKNSDVIAFFEAGFIGAWGEWHSSTHNTDTISNKEKVLFKLLDSLPNIDFIQIRYPDDKEDIFGTLELANCSIQPDKFSRTGYHNDCFLSSENDHTYPLNKIDYYKEKVKLDTMNVPIGGETCKIYETKTNCTKALKELSDFHFTYLNNNHKQEVVNVWKNNDCYKEIHDRLGYRFVVREATFPESIKKNEIFFLSIKIENNGWAKLYKNRDFYITIEQDDKIIHKENLNINNNDLLPNKIVNYYISTNSSNFLNPGNYKIYITAPDPSNNLSNRYEYAIPFNNENYDILNFKLFLGELKII